MKQRNKKIKKILKIVCSVIAIACFFWFLLPFVAAGILNIGNITGMILSFLVFLYILLQRKIHSWMKRGWEKGKFRRFLIRICGCMIVLIGLLTIIESICMIYACNRVPQENATAVVLGCRVYGERASLMLRERLDAAVTYLNDNPNASCVVSGGQGSGENISEAECMYRYLVEKGINPERIYKEDQSTSTEENLRFTLDLIKEYGINDDIALITNEFHIYRAGMIAKDCELNSGSVPAKTAMWLFPTYYVRELYAILAEWILN